MCPEHGRAVGVGERQLGFHLVIFHYILIQSRSWPATSYDRTAPRTCYITPAQNFDQTTNRWRTHFWSGRMREDYSKILRGTPDSLSRGAGMGLQSQEDLTRGLRKSDRDCTGSIFCNFGSFSVEVRFMERHSRRFCLEDCHFSV